MRWIVVFLGLSISLHACGASIEGRWTAFDEDTGRPRAIVEIVSREDTFTGRVVQFMPAAGEDAQPRCTACGGAGAGQPVIGMTVLVVRRTDGQGAFEGTLLDPEEGVEYRCVVTLASTGDELLLHGYVGLPLLGRTVTWRRAH